jgi:peptidyl-prolyl cis-trans isomerase B (cyclophilin B)
MTYNPGYPGYPGYPPPPPVRQTNAWAVAALVSSFVFAPMGIVAGHIALSQIKRTGDEGKGLAIAGLVIGYMLTAVMIVGLIFCIWLFVVVDQSVRNWDPNHHYGTYSMSVTSGHAVPTEQGPLVLTRV